MSFRVQIAICLLCVWPSFSWVRAALPDDGATVSYNFQVRPILAEHCFKCHGMDEKQRKAGLRLDVREEALASKAIVPGKAGESELIKRINTTDEDEVMPPPKEHRLLTRAQADVLRRWIEQGAPYEQHWAFVPPRKSPVPQPAHQAFTSGPIDAFILSRLDKEGLAPTSPASKEAWLRRVSLDLSGLPPTPAELDAFLSDPSSSAEARIVERLLGSPRFGERMASEWLDVARFADTFGRHGDSNAYTWPYRDWVVRAFNQNMPYDQFVLWQTAGDMIPGATLDSYLATAFNRLVLQSDEAGSNEEEFRCEHVADRMKTNGVAFLGLSLECARCHDHKYDPITQRDYYALSSFLANVDESGVFSNYTDAIPSPSLFVYEPGQEARHVALKLEVVMRERERESLRAGARERFMNWLAAGNKPVPAAPVAHLPLETFLKKVTPNLANPNLPGHPRRKPDRIAGRFGGGMKLDADNWLTVPGVGNFSRTQPFSFSVWLKTEALQERAVVVHHSRAGLDAASRGYELIMEHGKLSFALVHFHPGNSIRIRTRETFPVQQWTHLACTYDGSSRASGLTLFVNGVAADCEVVRDNLYKDITYEQDYKDLDDKDEVAFGAGARTNDKPLRDAVIDDLKSFDRELTPVEVRLLVDAVAYTKPEQWFAWYLRERDEPWRKASLALAEARQAENLLSHDLHEVMVMREMPYAPRPVYVLERGRFDSRRELVEPNTPSSFFPFPVEYPRNRLGYGRWLVDRRNPLTARVFVNRVWQMFFGQGIVATSEDFGLQGDLPSHPELLDWLAVDFMDHGWDVKRLCTMIALSATYRQSSESGDPSLLERDPDNRLLARGPRQRLTAEQLRDGALATSGLLDTKMGGPSVYPYQPADLYISSGIQATYPQSTGASLYRRSLYTYWKRTMPPPSMTVFDAPSREFCKTRRDKSSTPLQALALLNDPQFVEAARVMAENLVRQFPGSDADRVASAYRLLTSKTAGAWEQQEMTRLLDLEREALKAKPAEVEKLCHCGEHPPADGVSHLEVAATMSVVRALLAYHEAVMKP